MQFFTTLLSAVVMAYAASAAAVDISKTGPSPAVFKCLVDVGHANGCEVKECLCKKSAELEGPLEACVAPFGPDAIHELRCLAAHECHYKPERCP